ncbi:MAG: hypothetical protein ACQEUT_18315 [Bacillota bacterium]
MIFRITYRDDSGIHESIVVESTEWEALLKIKKEIPINSKFDVREIKQVNEAGVVSTKTIKKFKRPMTNSGKE